MVFADQLADTSAYVEHIYYIDTYTADEKVVTFSLTSLLDVLQVTLPCEKFLRNQCRHTFKSSECGYSGGETECNKTLQRCRELDNNSRYGGFPSIPIRRIWVG